MMSFIFFCKFISDLILYVKLSVPQTNLIYCNDLHTHVIWNMERQEHHFHKACRVTHKMKLPEAFRGDSEPHTRFMLSLRNVEASGFITH